VIPRRYTFTQYLDYWGLVLLRYLCLTPFKRPDRGLEYSWFLDDSLGFSGVGTEYFCNCSFSVSAIPRSS
jgi:hypothetical protein